MSGHTPGPWSTGKMLNPSGAPCVIGDDDTVVAILPGDWNYCTHSKADARLLAAAPELLEALQGLLEVADFISENVPGAGWRVAQHTARAVIAQATGESA